jgi:hypothetical protein
VLLPQDKEPAYVERAKAEANYGGKNVGAVTGHPAVERLYSDYFRKPIGDGSNRALRTEYTERKLSK